MLLRKTFRFEASHVLPKHPGKCSRLHGHSWVLHVFVEGEINPETGFVIDYGEISKAVKPLVENLDHRHLGQWVDEKYDWIITSAAPDKGPHPQHSWHVPNMDKQFYPSSENLLFWIADQLTDLNWSKLAIEETCTSYCELTKTEYTEAKSINGYMVS